MTDIPVLLTIFNRPEPTSKVFAAIREARPKRLFVAADGPRPDRPDDEAACQATREQIRVDWPCDVQWRIAEGNHGCRLGMFNAVSWFFEQVESGVVFEDDCLPHQTFFPFCAELLEHYRDDDRIFGISGNNFTQNRPDEDSYYFLKTTHIWGWSTWRQKWNMVDLLGQEWPALRDAGMVDEFLKRPHTKAFWGYILDDLHGRTGNTWSGAIIYTMLKHRMVGIHPVENLVSNIGFGNTGVHVTPIDHKLSNVPAIPMTFPLRHPTSVDLSVNFDDYVEDVWDIAPSGT